MSISSKMNSEEKVKMRRIRSKSAVDQVKGVIKIKWGNANLEEDDDQNDEKEGREYRQILSY